MTKYSISLKKALRLIVVTGLACGFLMGLAYSAEGPEIEAAVGQTEVFVGDSIDFQIEIRNSKNPSAPDLSSLKQEFDVVSRGDQSRNQSSTFVFNGKVTRQEVFSHIYQYRLTPKAAGEISIPSVTATVDGKQLSTNEMTLKVVEPEKQDLVIVEIETSSIRVYPTQPFDVTARFFVRPLPGESDRDPLTPVRNRPPHLQINWVEPIAGLRTDELSHWLQPLRSEDGVGITLNNVTSQTNSLFDSPRPTVLNLATGRKARNDLEGQTVNYFVYELTRRLTAERSGDYSFGPAVIKGTFVTGIERKEYLGKRLIAIAPAQVVHVQDIPSPRPANFCGGIGEHAVLASASPTTLRVGDPLTLTVSIERQPESGSLDLISAPDLSTVAELTDGFELIDRNPTGRVEGSAKRFSFSLRPKRPGVTIPSIPISTFDPATEQFIDHQTTPISLIVTEAEQVTSRDLIGSSGTSPSSSMKSRAEGIYQNITDPAEVTDQRIDLKIWLISALGSWIAAGVLMIGLKFRRRHSSNIAWQRRQQARTSANRRLAEARSLLQRGETHQSLGQIRSAITELVADLQNRAGQGLTTNDVAAALSAANVPEADRSQLIKLLDLIEAAEYGATSSVNAANTLEQAVTLITRIAGPLERHASQSAKPILVIGPLLIALIGNELHAADRGERERAFLKALEQFDQAQSADDYRESAKLLESTLSNGFQSGAIYYNLGNAYYRAGDYGRAILNYRKAKPYRPTDPYLTANLEQAIAVAPGCLPPEAPPWWRHVLFWSDWISLPRKVQVVFGLAIVAAITAALGLVIRRPKWNLAAGLILLFSATMGIELGLSYSDAVGSRRAVITGETIARKGTGQSYEPAFDQPLKDGAEFNVLNETADWTFGHFPNIGDGWVRNEYVAR